MAHTSRCLGLAMVVALVAASCAPAARPAAPAQPVAPAAPAAPATPRPAAATPAPVPTTAAAKPADQPRYGGVLVGYNATPSSNLDLAQVTQIVAQQMMVSAYNTLVRLDPQKLPNERVFIGSLATQWTLAPDGTGVTFRLREGVKFHDGKPFTSADVKATVDRIRDAPDKILSPIKSYFKGAVVETPDPMRAVFKSPVPLPFTLQLFAAPFLSIVPKHVVEADQHALEKMAVGTGPFKFSKWDRNISLELVRNPDYWEKGRPYLDGTRWLDIPEPSTQVAAFRAGRVNITGTGTRGLSKSDMDALQRDVPGVRIIQYTFSSIRYTLMNNTAPPFDNPKVRQAVAMVLDHKELINSAFEGLGYSLDFVGPAAGVWGLPKEKQQQIPILRGVTEADRNAARKLLAEAGYPNGLDVEFLVHDVQEGPAVVTMEQIRKIGIRSKGRVVKIDQWLAAGRDKQYAITWGSVSFAIFDPAVALGMHIKGNLDNRTGYTNPKVEEAYKRVLSTVDPAARKLAVDEIQTILWADVPAVPSAVQYFLLGLRPEVRGYTHPGLLNDNLQFETTWLAPQ